MRLKEICSELHNKRLKKSKVIWLTKLIIIVRQKYISGKETSFTKIANPIYFLNKIRNNGITLVGAKKHQMKIERRITKL